MIGHSVVSGDVKNTSDIDIACNAIIEKVVLNHPNPTTLIEIVKHLRKLDIGFNEPSQVESLVEYLEKDLNLIYRDDQYVCCATMIQYRPKNDKDAMERISEILEMSQTKKELSKLSYFDKR